MAFVFAPVALVAATGDWGRELDPTSVLDYILVLSALFFPAVGGLIVLKSKSDSGIPQQLKEAIHAIRTVKG
jgi:hypothetical protein